MAGNVVLRLIDDRTGKLVAECLSHDACEREARWRSIDKWHVEKTERNPSWGYDEGLSKRFVPPWSESKISDFKDRYLAGESLKSLCEVFGTTDAALIARARKLGIPKRPSWPVYWEKHTGKWTAREDELVNFLYEEGLTTDEVGENVERTEVAVRARLSKLRPPVQRSDGLRYSRGRPRWRRRSSC